ncbi:MAG: sigma-70 family RNA polymerase sigma factor [Byssovorax sp.]
MRERCPLALAFLAARPPAERETAPDPLDLEAIEASLQRLLADGRAAWSSAAIDAAAFARYVAARAPGPSAAHVDRLQGADLFLACACAAGDAGSVAAFDRRYLAPLPPALIRKGIARDLADDVVQSLRERVVVGAGGARAKIVDYDGRGSLAGWVRVAAIRAASNARRDEGQRATLADDAGGPAAMTVIDPELALIKRRYGEAFQAALRDAFAALGAEERNVLRLYFTDGLNLDAIARVLGISRATAGRRMISGRAGVLEETLRLLGERLPATPTELQSLLGIVRSKLDVSLGALVREA